RYSIYLSGRRDGSNLFGANTNNRWKPLWSAGGRWNITNEPFFNIAAISKLVLRATYGYAGNINNTIPAMSTISYFSYNSFFGQQMAQIVNPPNPDLRWEEVRSTNLGVELNLFSNRLSTSF